MRSLSTWTLVTLGRKPSDPSSSWTIQTLPRGSTRKASMTPEQERTTLAKGSLSWWLQHQLWAALPERIGPFTRISVVRSELRSRCWTRGPYAHYRPIDSGSSLAVDLRSSRRWRQLGFSSITIPTHCARMCSGASVASMEIVASWAFVPCSIASSAATCCRFMATCRGPFAKVFAATEPTKTTLQWPMLRLGSSSFAKQ
mmetsp:Transcript_166935/g.530859  ORF Transcript_166935/g.530859 Transcript_166935/m.530859 type:complete len:200 (-) Transcript_166935:593-1192(-)